jgi:hypothetical protein
VPADPGAAGSPTALEPEAPAETNSESAPAAAQAEAPSTAATPEAEPATAAAAQAEASSTAATPEEDGATVAAERRRGPIRRGIGWVLTGIAGAIVLLALNVPNTMLGLTPKTFARFPIEVVVFGGLLVVLGGRARRWTATVLGFLLGLLVIVKCLDMGFYYVLVRPWDPVFDWVLLSDGVNYVYGIYGKSAAVAAVVGVIVAVLAVVAASILAVRRLSKKLLTGHETSATRIIAVLAVVWVFCAAFGQSTHGLPRATDITSAVAYATTKGIPGQIADKHTFSKELNEDAYRNTPASQLIPGLKGKNVIFTFVESYGQTAAEDPQVSGLLAAGTQKLESEGFSTRSAWMTSPTAGGGSFLAHSTLFSGLWIDNEARYRELVKSDRLTLSSAFKKANYRTVGVMPGLTGKWPEAGYFGYDWILSANSNGFGGPKYNWAAIPDQYILSNLQRTELSKPGHKPVMAEVETTSSHIPWTYVPTLVDWDKVGNGRATAGKAPDVSKHDADWTRDQYRRTIEYSLNTLISYVEKYGDDNLVMVFLGDHQPVPTVAGDRASRNVPITIVAKDKKVVNQIASWNWTDGLKPGTGAPTWKMDAFRDKFLSAFGSTKSN